MKWSLSSRLIAVAGVIASLVFLTPYAAAEPGDVAVVDSPTLSFVDLGVDRTLSFYGESSSTTLSFPVPTGLVPAALNATVDLPFPVRSGVLTVTQDDRMISKLGLPLADLAPVVIPLAGVEVVDDTVNVTMTLSALPEDRFCLDELNAVELINGSITYTGTEGVPTTVADFLPAVLRKLTIAVPSKPSQAESDAAVQLTAAMTARYRSQAPQVVVVPLADGATTPDGPAAPMERQVVIKEGQDEGLSLAGGPGIPALLISGSASKLTNQTRLLTDGSLNMAVSTRVVAGELHQNPRFPGNSTTLAQLGQPALTSAGLAPVVDIALDQTRFGHSTQGYRVHLVGSYTPIPVAFGAQLTVSVGGEVIDTWPAEAGGVIDRWVNVPDRLVARYTSVAVRVNTSGFTGRCGEFRPLTLTIRGSTVVESTPAKPPIPPGFPSLPQALMPQVQIGIGANSFADTVRAAQIIAGLQRLSVVRLLTSVTSLEQAIGSHDPAILISADGWTNTSIALPVNSEDRRLTITGPAPGDTPTTLTLEPGVQFGSLQTVFDGNRSLLVATSNGAPGQLDELLRWLDGAPERWSQLRGSAMVAVAGRAPEAVTGRTPASVYGPPAAESDVTTTAGSYRYNPAWWVAAAVVVAAAVGALAIISTARRTKSDDSRPGRD